MIDPPAFIAALSRRIGRRRELRQNEVLFRLGDLTRGVFYVERGRVSLRRHTAAGRLVVIHNAEAGTLFAEASLYAAHYRCDAVAEMRSAIVELPKRALLDTFAQDIEVAQSYSAYLAREVMRLRARLELSQVRSAQERILAYLALEADTDGVARLDRPWKSIAAEIGLSCEAVYRALAALERKHSIARCGSTTIRLR